MFLYASALHSASLYDSPGINTSENSALAFEILPYQFQRWPSKCASLEKEEYVILLSKSARSY